MDEENTWTVELRAFSFQTKEEAAAFCEALTDAFCNMPEADGVAAFSTFWQYDPDDASLGRETGPFFDIILGDPCKADAGKLNTR